MGLILYSVGNSESSDVVGYSESSDVVGDSKSSDLVGDSDFESFFSIGNGMRTLLIKKTAQNIWTFFSGKPILSASQF